MRPVLRAFLRYLPRRKALTAAELLSIAFGVAAAVGMALSARAALGSFERAVAFVQGRATHRLERPAGPLEESVLARLAADPAVEAFAPVLDRRLALPSGEVVRLLGIDPFLDRGVRPRLLPTGRPADLRLVLAPRSVLLGEALARRVGAAAGRDLATARGPLEVLGTFPDPAGEPLAVIDVGHAQALFGLGGLLDRVDLVLADPAGFAVRWGHGFRVESVQENRAAYAEMLRAFRLNLEALSLLGLFVGLFLIYNTAMFAVVSRRRDAGVLISLGADRTSVCAAFAVEVLLLGACGGAAGGALGHQLARVLTERVGSTISSLYFFLRPEPAAWEWKIAAAGVLLGCAASLLGAAFPLLELWRTEPVAALQGRVPNRGGGRRARRSAAAGAGVLAAAAVLLAAAGERVYAGFGGAFALLLGASLLTGVVLAAAGPALAFSLGRLAGLPGRLAAGNLSQNLGRTSVAVAAFMVALSMSIGLGLMIGSFRRTLEWWMQGQLTGDLYVAPSSEVEAPEELYLAVRALPGVGGVDPYRNVRVAYRGTIVHVAAVDASVLRRFARFGWRAGSDASWAEVERGAAIVSESFERRFGVGRGNTVRLQTAGGEATLPVAGVFYDYTTEHGLVMLDRATYLRLYGDRRLDSFSVFLEPGNPRNAVLTAEVRRLAGLRGVPVASGAELHGQILSVFDATFATTRAMRLLAVVVAFFGIAGALLTLQLERQRDFGVLRALGFARREVVGMALAEGLAMGTLAFLLATAVGTALSGVLIRVINLQSFHWTIFFRPAPGPYFDALGVALLAGGAASALPMWRTFRTFPDVQLREE